MRVRGPFLSLCKRTVEIGGTGPSLTLKDSIGPDMWVTDQPPEQQVALWPTSHSEDDKLTGQTQQRQVKCVFLKWGNYSTRFQELPFLGNLGDLVICELAGSF